MKRLNGVFALPFLLLAFGPPVAAQEPAPAAQGALEIVVPAGTVIPIVLSAYLNSQSAQVGDAFYADTVYPVWIQQRLVIPRGSTIKGTVTEVVRAGRIRGKGRLAVRLDSIILPNGVTRDLVASFRGIHSSGAEKLDRASETVQAESSKGVDVGTIAGTTTQGAIIGALADRGKGTAIGAGAGALVGTTFVLLSRGRDLVLPPGTQFDIELKQPLRFVYGELQFSPGELNSAARSAAPRPRPQDRPQRQRLGRFGLPGIWRVPWP